MLEHGVRPSDMTALSLSTWNNLTGRTTYEPKVGPTVVRPVRAHCSERVRIAWTMPDGSVYSELYTAPPLIVIEARRKRMSENSPRCPKCNMPQDEPAGPDCPMVFWHSPNFEKAKEEAIATTGQPRYVLTGGATRSEKAPAYFLIPGEGLRRTALRFGLGAEKHGPWNWTRSVQTEENASAFAQEAYNHMMEHIRKMVAGIELDDDHLGAIGWAQSVLCYIEDRFKKPWTQLRDPKQVL
jgi:dATP/dGTP diphosphohydrolase